MVRTSVKMQRRAKSYKPARGAAKARLARARGNLKAARASGSVKRQAVRMLANSSTAGFLGLEKKFYDTYLTATALAASVDATGGMIDPSATSMISTPAQGDTEQSRDGKRIVIKSCQVNGFVYTGELELQAGPPASTKVLVALVLDTQSNAAQCTSDLIFKNSTASATGAVSPLRNLLYAARFKVLKSEVLDLDTLTTSHVVADAFAMPGKGVAFNWYLPMELPVNFNAGTTSTIANVIDNSLHMVAYTTSTALAPKITYNARIRFMG